MEEIEILYSLIDSPKEVVDKIEKYNRTAEDKIVHVKDVSVLDMYFYNTSFDSLSPDAANRLRTSFRLRKKGDQNYLTYKKDIFDENNIWLYSDEYETKVEDFATMENILCETNFVELVRIDNHKQTFKNSRYEIVIEDVKDLGYFIEVERMADKNISKNEALKIKNDIRSFVEKIGITIGEELNAGKPELMLKKKLNNK